MTAATNRELSAFATSVHYKSMDSLADLLRRDWLYNAIRGQLRAYRPVWCLSVEILLIVLVQYMDLSYTLESFALYSILSADVIAISTYTLLTYTSIVLWRRRPVPLSQREIQSEKRHQRRDGGLHGLSVLTIDGKSAHGGAGLLAFQSVQRRHDSSVQGPDWSWSSTTWVSSQHASSSRNLYQPRLQMLLAVRAAQKGLRLRMDGWRGSKWETGQYFLGRCDTSETAPH